MQEKQDTLDKLLELLSGFDIIDKLDIISQLFITEGLKMMQIPEATINTQPIIEILQNYEDAVGETLGGAMLRQGIVFHAWIQSLMPEAAEA